MAKRSGLGQRGLDLLIPASSQKEQADPEKQESAAAKKSRSGKKSTGTQKAGTKSSGSKTARAAKRTSSDQTRKAPSGKKKTASSAGANAAQSFPEHDRNDAADHRILEEVLPSADPVSEEKKIGQPVLVPISLVEPNREQPRRNFNEDALQELAESIRQYGIIQPLIVQKKEGYYEIIAGERRWRAARIASVKEVPVLIREYTPREVMEISLIENIQREDLNPIEEAGAFRRLMEEYALTQDEVAQRVSKSRAAIANSVRLLNLDKRVQDMIVEQMLSTGHARALLAITDPEQQFQIAQRVFDEKMTVRDVERLVRRLNEVPASGKKRGVSEALQAIYADLAEQMKSVLGTKVSIAAKTAQRGKIEIEYFSSDELDRLCMLLNSVENREEV